MRKLRILIGFIFGAAFFWSCEEEYILDTGQAPPQVVIEGLVTNEIKQHYLKISQTTDFYASGQSPRVSNAQVLVTDDQGNSFPFLEQEDSLGLYLSDQPFQGIEGRTYTLEVTLNGQMYKSTETLMRVTKIDSLIYEIDEEEMKWKEDHPDQVDEEDVGRYYIVRMYTKEPQDTEDYYLFKFYRDGDLQNYFGEDIYYAEDTFVREEINGIEANDWYRPGEVARVEMYSLTRNAYLFYADLDITLNNDGGLFSPLPSNPRSNISNGALGIFQVSAIDAAEIKIE